MSLLIRGSPYRQSSAGGGSVGGMHVVALACTNCGLLRFHQDTAVPSSRGS
jgi:hypothetical protein